MSGMKKFFGIGLLALLTTAYLTSSCSRDEFSGSLLEAKAEAFNNAFRDVYGDPDPQHTWGFGDEGATRAFTRGIDPDANMWADTYKVPTQLTQAQKDLVRKYFQQNPIQKYEDPKLTNFFMQQVYKGGTTTKTKGDPTDPDCGTAEEYASANGGWVIGSNHMDHLAACNQDGTIKDHIYNFNFGTCSTNNDVSNSAGVTYTNPNGNYHSDEIQLALNSTTKKFGYFNSDGSLGHTEYTCVVSWKTIAKWAMESGNENISNINQSILNDDWNRSFMGFDFEQVVGEDVYQGNALYSDMPGFDRYIWDGENVIDVVDHYDEKNNWAPVFKEGYETLKYKGKTVRCLKNETNQYCGDRKWKDGGDLYEEVTAEHTNAIIIYKDGKKCLNMPFIYDMLDDDYLPVATKNFREWVKVEGGADGYFSDWIVTLTEAKPNNGSTTPSEGTDLINVQRIVDGRIFCEDLGSADHTDIDFNDVVFDAFTYITDTYEVPYTLTNGNKVYNWNNKLYRNSEYYKTDINLLAAGGTIDIQVAGQDVNSLLDIQKTIMANTYVEGASTNKSGYTNFRDGVQPYKFTVNNNDYTNLGEIPIAVKSGNSVRELSANVGDVPQKFRAPVGTPWPVERKAIDYGFSRFRDWVGSEQQNNNLWYYMTPESLYHVKFISNVQMNQWGGTIRDFGTDYPYMLVNGETPITITLNEALETGDQIAITGFRNQADNATGTLYIECNSSVVASTQDFNNKAFNPNGIQTKENTFVFTVTSAMAGNSSFQLTKDTSGAEIYITSVTVIGGLGAQRDETTSGGSTPVTPVIPGGQGEEEESDPTFSSVTGTDLNIDPTTLTTNSSLTLPAASFNNVSAATIYIYGTGNGEVLVNGVSATTESSAPRFGFTRSATPVVKVCQLGPSNLKTNRVVVSGYNFRVVKCSMVNQTGNYSVSEPSGKGDIIYNTSTILDWGDNGGAVTITNDALKGAKIGSKIRVFGIGYASSYWEVQAFGFNTTGGWNTSTKLSPQDGTSFSGNGAKEIVFPITTQAQANMVKGGRIVVQGYNFILKYVTVENPSSSSDDDDDEGSGGDVETVLWSDSQGVAVSDQGTINLSNTNNIGSSGTLRFYLTHTGRSGQITAMSTDGWSVIYSGGYSVGVTYGENKDFALTGTMCAKLREEKKIKLAGQDLKVTGVSYIPPAQ